MAPRDAVGASIYYTVLVKNSAGDDFAPTRVPSHPDGAGPIPLPDVPAARERVLEALASQGAAGHPATIVDLVGDLGGHPNTTRAHLGRLVADGLAERVALETGTRGRPAHGHRVTERGRLVLEAVRVARPVSTDELVSAMAEHLATTPDPKAHARAIGRRWAAQLAEEPRGPAGRPRAHRAQARTPVDTVVSLMSTAGFSPQAEPSGDVALRTCPVLASAREHPEVLCTMHEEMLRTTLERSGVLDVEAALVPFARDGACIVRLRQAGH